MLQRPPTAVLERVPEVTYRRLGGVEEIEWQYSSLTSLAAGIRSLHQEAAALRESQVSMPAIRLVCRPNVSYCSEMGKADSLDAVSELSLADRSEILARLLQLEAADDLRGPSASERQLLDEELEDYRANPEAGAAWKAVENRLRRGT